MFVLFVILCLLLVLAVVAITIWLWLFMDVFDQAAALVRIRVEEQVAMWRIESINRISQTEQRRIRDAHRPRSMTDL